MSNLNQGVTKRFKINCNRLLALPKMLKEQAKANYLLLTLIIVNLTLFVINYSYGKYYAIADIPLFELNPQNELWKRLFLWQAQRGFGLELGQEFGLTILLGFLSLLSMVGLGPLTITYIYNMGLFILPAIAVYFLSYAFFYSHEKRKQIAFFSGLLGNLNFYVYITGNHPLFLRKFPLIMTALLLGTVILILKTGKKRYWILFGIFSFINLSSFTAPAFFVPGALFIVFYLLFYLAFESKNISRDMLKMLGIAIVFLSISAPGIVANVHLLFYSDFLKSPLFANYTRSLFQLNQEGLDNSQLVNSFRLIGTVNWGSLPTWKGALVYPYYTIFTYNPVFITLSFLLPALAFGVLLLKNDSATKRTLTFLAVVSLLFLFLIKGMSKPFGEVFLWMMQNIPLFMIFRQPYDKAGIILMITMSLAAGFSLMRFLDFAKARLIVRNGFQKALGVSLIILIAASIFVNSYPALTGDVFDRVAFFELPQAYYDLQNSVNSDPALYKIVVLPELGYSNQLSWGYFGIGLHSWGLTKPIIARSFTGSDIYSETMTDGVLHEVAFLSTAHYPHNDFDENEAIFPNENITKNIINLQRVKYFNYLLEKSNIGKVIYRNDYKGIGSANIQDVDVQRYQLLFETMTNSNYIKMDHEFGELTLYSVNSWKPLIYLSSEDDTYGTPEYDVFIDTYSTNARYAVFASLFDYNATIDFVHAEGIAKTSNHIYAPLFLAKYFNKINGQLNEEKSNLEPDANKIQSLQEKVEAFTQYQNQGWQYYDNIESVGDYDLYMKILPPPPPSPTTQAIVDINQIASRMYEEVAKDNLALDSFVNEIETILQETSLSELAEKLRNFVRDLDIAVTNRDRQAILDRLEDLKAAMNYQAPDSAETLNGQEMLFYTNGKSIRLELNLSQTNAYWYRAGTLSLEKGTFLARKSFVLNPEMVLVHHGNTSLERSKPKISFYQVNPQKFKILIENVAEGFYLNFLESFSARWQLYPMRNIGFDKPVIRSYSDTYELEYEKAIFEVSDMNALWVNSPFDQDHYLLNGFANSWYIDVGRLNQSSWATVNSDGTYSLTLELYYQPQSYLYLSIIVGVLATFAAYLVVLSAAMQKRLKRIAKQLCKTASIAKKMYKE